MKKGLAILTAVLVLTFASGCLHDRLFARLENAPDHCQANSGDNFWIDFGIRCSFDNPFDD